jgi:hypothetical protein
MAEHQQTSRADFTSHEFCIFDWCKSPFMNVILKTEDLTKTYQRSGKTDPC